MLPTATVASASLQTAAERLAALLTGVGGGLAHPGGGHLEFDAEVRLRPLSRAAAPPAEVWAVDGGQAVVADARCLQLVVARAARTCFRCGTCEVEEEGELRAYLLGGGENRAVAAGLGLGIAEDATVDLNLLRDHHEWVLVDGDLETDWRVPPSWLADLLGRAAARKVVVAAVTKRSSLSRGGVPLLGALEMEAGRDLGPRAMWWAPVARSRAGARVVAARLDPDAPYAFRVDVSPGADPEEVLSGLAAVCDDAGFPGYPYPLTVADRLAACPPWLRQDTWYELD
ncbi:MAG TPA: DNA double-strand break repair nuclease NurA, partial [Acidimicrobiales bacterium]|nr:DNA double-strand break repair nuclease NurA [Acidimicrobiales bacterium]